MHVFRSFLFLVEKILTFESVDMARAEGYEFIFRAPTSELEGALPPLVDGSIWDIPRTVTEGDSDADMNKKNMDLLENVASDFPSLSVTLRYKKVVKRSEQDKDDGFSEFFDDILFCPIVEQISLHRFAMGLLVEMFSARNFMSVLSSSALSLRAVHIFAIALRGLIKKCLGDALTGTEEAALGDVFFKLLEKGEELATVMVGNRYEKPKEGDEKSNLEKEREKLLHMTWAQYKAAKTQHVEDVRALEESTRSAVGQGRGNDEEGEDDDYDISWIG